MTAPVPGCGSTGILDAIPKGPPIEEIDVRGARGRADPEHLLARAAISRTGASPDRSVLWQPFGAVVDCTGCRGDASRRRALPMGSRDGTDSADQSRSMPGLQLTGCREALMATAIRLSGPTSARPRWQRLRRPQLRQQPLFGARAAFVTESCRACRAIRSAERQIELRDCRRAIDLDGRQIPITRSITLATPDSIPSYRVSKHCRCRR
jgi:hypothetical protein